jgi:mannose-6-phosphate isomerase-like protein (cupin superfamily)
MEQMPAGTEESLHFHQYAQQFFFILKGQAVFEIEGNSIIVKEEEGIHIRAGEKHKIMNQSNVTLQFLLCSQPSTTTDRHNLA